LNFFLGLFCFTSSSGSSWTNAMSPLRCDQFSPQDEIIMAIEIWWTIITEISWHHEYQQRCFLCDEYVYSKLHYLLTAVRNNEKHIETWWPFLNLVSWTQYDEHVCFIVFPNRIYRTPKKIEQ
jgi:hypothetical protein